MTRPSSINSQKENLEDRLHEGTLYNNEIQ